MVNVEDVPLIFKPKVNLEEVPMNGKEAHDERSDSNRKRSAGTIGEEAVTKRLKISHNITSKPKKDCPWHKGHHTWYHCFGNPDGPNYKPNYKLPPLPSTLKSGGGSRKNDGGKRSGVTKRSDVTDTKESIESSGTTNKVEDLFGSTLNDNNKDVVPVYLCLPESINSKKPSRVLTALLDSGSALSWISSKALPVGCKPSTVKHVTGKTLVGELQSTRVVFCHNTKFPEFHGTRRVQRFMPRVVDIDCGYDMIIGRDMLRTCKMLLDFDENRVISTVFDSAYPMRTKDELRTYSTKQALREALCLDLRLSNEAAKDADLFAAEIRDADYHKVDIADVVAKCNHLEPGQRQQLEYLLYKHQKLFDGTLGKYPHGKVHLDVQPNAKPVHKWHYPVPRVHYNTFKKELLRLVAIGVLEPCGPSECVLHHSLSQKETRQSDGCLTSEA